MDAPPSPSLPKSSKPRPARHAKKSSARRAYGSGYLGQSSGAQQQASSSSAATTSPTGSQEFERRKRSRVNTEQLVQLEVLFAVDRSPSVEQRKEISASLGMHERQTQIWFQNRRAKEKIREGRIPRTKKQKRPVEEGTPPKSPPVLSTGFDAELHSFINEEAAITIIPCDTLTIGTWKRLRASDAKHTLVAYICDSQRRLSWFVHNAGKGFKMSIPFNTIVSAEFSQRGSTGPGMASLTISRTPFFFFETTGIEPNEADPSRQWRRCNDWTENFQATRVLRHHLTGPSGPLAHFIGHIQSSLAALDEQQLEGESSAQSPSSAPSPSDDYSSSQGSISPLETRTGLPAAETFEPAFNPTHAMFYRPSADKPPPEPSFHPEDSTTPTPQSATSYVSANLTYGLQGDRLPPPQTPRPESIRTGLPAPDMFESRFDSAHASSSRYDDALYYHPYPPPMALAGHYPYPQQQPPPGYHPSDHSAAASMPPTLTRYYTLQYPFEEATTPTATATPSHVLPPHSFASSSSLTSLPATYNYPPQPGVTYGHPTTDSQSYYSPPSRLNPEEPALISPAPYSASAQRLQEDFLENYYRHQ